MHRTFCTGMNRCAHRPQTQVKEAGEYAGGHQPWLRDVDRLIFLLNGYHDPSFRSLVSEPGTPLSEDSDFAYLKAVSDSRPVSASGPVHSTGKSSCAEDTGARDYAPLSSPGHPSSADENYAAAGTPIPTSAQPVSGGIRGAEWHVTTAGAHSARSIASISDSSRSSGSGDARCLVTAVGMYCECVP